MNVQIARRSENIYWTRLHTVITAMETAKCSNEERFWIIGDETKAVPASDVVDVIPPVNGARDELTSQWLHFHFGNNISSLEYRRFRAFLHGYSGYEYMQGVRQGITIQQRKQSGTELMYEDNKIYLQSYERREQLGLAFEVKADELVKCIQKVVFLDGQNSSDVEGVVGGAVDDNVQNHGDGVLEGESGGDPDEFSNEWFQRVFPSIAMEKTEEHMNIDRAIWYGNLAATYAGVLRGIEIERRVKRGEELKGADLDFVRGRILWLDGYDEVYIAADVERARGNDTKAFLKD